MKKLNEKPVVDVEQKTIEIQNEKDAVMDNDDIEEENVLDQNANIIVNDHISESITDDLQFE